MIRQRIPTNITELTKLLDSRNSAEAYCAAEALQERSSEAISALPRLISAADQANHSYSTIEQIAAAHPRLAVGPLIHGLAVTNPRVRWTCAQALGQIGTNASSAAPALLAALNAETSDPHIFAYSLLQVSGDCSAAIPRLCTILKDGTNLYQKRAVLWVLEHAGPQAAPALPDVLKLATASEATNSTSSINNFDLRLFALGTLSRVCPSSEVALKPILSALNAPMPDRVRLRPAAIRALGNLGAAGLPHLIPIYQGTNQQDRLNAVQTLVNMGPIAAGALDIFIADLNSNDLARLTGACDIIANLGQLAGPAMPALRNLLLVPNRRIRIHAARTLTRLGEYNDTMVVILVETVGEMSRTFAGDTGLALSTLGQIVRTNAEARLIFEQRLRTNPKTAAYLKANRQLFKYYGLPVL
jgi:HEAT repeat protein